MTASHNEEPQDPQAMSGDGKKRLSPWQIGGLVILGVLVLLSTQFVWVCHDPDISFSVENRLDIPITVQLDGYAFDELESGKSGGYATIKGQESYHLHVVDVAGTLLFEQTYTEQELDSADTIVIDEP